jgi:hypothetical protein
MTAHKGLVAAMVLLGICAASASARTPKAPVGRPKLELLSLTGLPLGRADRLWSFRVDIQRARIVGVCGFPDGWDMKFGNYADPKLYKEGGAYVEGGAMFDHNALGPDATGALNRFVLIRPDGPPPPRLDGGFTVEAAGKGEARHRFAAANFRIDPASRCPAQSAKPAGR